MENNDKESKDSEDKIKDSEIKYRTLFEQAADAIVLINPENGDLVEFNKKAYEQLGYTQEEFKQLKIPDFEIIESAEEVKEHIENIAREGSDKFETKHRTKAGDIRDIHVSAKTMDIRGKKYIQVIWRDITERKKLEEEVYEERDLIRTLFENHPDFIYFKDSKARFQHISKRFCEFFGSSMEEIIGKTDLELFPEQMAKRSYNDDLHVINTGIPLINKEENAAGVWVLTTKIAWFDKKGNKKGLFGISHDITERKQAEQKLKESEARYRNLINNIHETIFELDENGNIEYMSPQVYDISGYRPEEQIGVNLKDLIHPDDLELVLINFKNLIQSGKVQTADFRRKHKDGHYVYVNSSGRRVKIGNKYKIIGVTKDITERKIAEQKLIESEEKYKNLADELEMILDHIPALVFYKDMENNFIRLNKYHADAHKLRKEDMQGVSCFNIYPKEQAQAYWDDDLEVARTKKPKLNIIEPWDTPEGTRWALTSKIPYFDEQGKITGIIGLASDITERIYAEDKLKESEANYRDAYEQAEFYKDLFAHDISNILQNIQSSLGLLSMWQNQPEKMNKISELMTIISDQLIRGSKLVANIRKLSEISEAESHIEPLDGLQILKDAKKFIHKSYPYKDLNIEVESEFEEVNIKANQLLLDVFENILFNSIKYNQNKKIDILTKISKEIKNGIKYVKIEFIDNGIGVPDVMKERIFKGISDRKEKIHGMGLGLLLVKRVLSIYNGDISVEDKVKGDPSQGSNFIILIPEVV